MPGLLWGKSLAILAYAHAKFDCLMRESIGLLLLDSLTMPSTLHLERAQVSIRRQVLAVK